ncbi:MAG TPA: DUF6515 family protein [Steroidobacter sp.]
MNTRKSFSWLACVALGLTQIAHAAPGPDRDRGPDRHYPREGYEVRNLPRERHAIIAPGGSRYFYSRGVWYAPRGPSYVVVHAPIGLFVPVLPPFYTTVWFGGSRYFLADDTYYMWRDRERSYEVVDPPEQASTTANTSSAGSDNIFMYPKDGQSADQQAKDRYECHRWAADETQFDPTQPGGGVADEQNASKRADYRRAMTACLEGRGYSVK